MIERPVNRIIIELSCHKNQECIGGIYAGFWGFRPALGISQGSLYFDKD
jgi:hypothetical protein